MWVRALAMGLAVVGLIALVVFLVGQGRSRSDEWMSIVGGLATVTGLLMSWLLSRPAPAARDRPDTAVLSATVGELRPTELGVKVAIRRDNNDSYVPEYVRRSCDTDLERAIAAGGLVVVHGPAAAGKTRSAVAAVQRLYPARRLIAPADVGAFRELACDAAGIRDAVIWLDDLDRFVSADTGHLALLVTGVRRTDRPDVVVVATIRDKALESAPALAAIEHRRIEVQRTLDRSEERSIDELSAGDWRLTEARRAKVGFGEFMVAGAEMIRRWSASGIRMWRCVRQSFPRPWTAGGPDMTKQYPMPCSRAFTDGTFRRHWQRE